MAQGVCVPRGPCWSKGLRKARNLQPPKQALGSRTQLANAGQEHQGQAQGLSPPSAAAQVSLAGGKGGGASWEPLVGTQQRPPWLWTTSLRQKGASRPDPSPLSPEEGLKETSGSQAWSRGSPSEARESPERICQDNWGLAVKRPSRPVSKAVSSPLPIARKVGLSEKWSQANQALLTGASPTKNGKERA